MFFLIFHQTAIKTLVLTYRPNWRTASFRPPRRVPHMPFPNVHSNFRHRLRAVAGAAPAAALIATGLICVSAGESPATPAIGLVNDETSDAAAGGSTAPGDSGTMKPGDKPLGRGIGGWGPSRNAADSPGLKPKPSSAPRPPGLFAPGGLFGPRQTKFGPATLAPGKPPAPKPPAVTNPGNLAPTGPVNSGFRNGRDSSNPVLKPSAPSVTAQVPAKPNTPSVSSPKPGAPAAVNAPKPSTPGSGGPVFQKPKPSGPPTL